MSNINEFYSNYVKLTQIMTELIESCQPYFNISPNCIL